MVIRLRIPLLFTPSMSTIIPTMSMEKKREDPDTTEKGSTTYAASTVGLEQSESFKGQERKVLRKLDSVILPLTALLYASSSFLASLA